MHGGGVRKTTKTIQQLAMLSDRMTAAIGNFKISETRAARTEISRPKPLASKPPTPPQPAPQPPQPMVPFLQHSSELTELAPGLGQSHDEDEDELITEEDFFKGA